MVGSVFDAFWDLKYMVFGCFAGAPRRGFRCLRGWVFDSLWNLKYMVFCCFAGVQDEAMVFGCFAVAPGCLTIHCL